MKNRVFISVRLAVRSLAMFAVLWSGLAYAATILPNGKQTFVDNSGNPLSGGQVFFYIPSTLTAKNTWQDSAQTILNANPVILDSAGRAIIFGTGCYRQRVLDALSNLIWDQVTCDTSISAQSYAGISGGSSNAQTLTASSFTSQDGQAIAFRPGATNTGPFTLTVNGLAPIVVYKDALAGTTALGGNEIIAGNVATVVYDTSLGAFHLVGGLPAYVGGQALVSTTSTLTATSFGKVTGVTANVTITLPAPTSIGALIRIYGSGSAFTLTTPFGILSGPAGSAAASKTVSSGEINDLVADGVNWIAIAASRGFGTSANNAVALDAAAKLPAVDASQVINLSSTGRYTNLKINYASATTFTVTADRIITEAGGGAAYAVNAVSHTVNSGTAGLNGLDTGSMAGSSTFYAVWEITLAGGTTPGAIISLSDTAPTMPGSYVAKRRLGHVLWNGTAFVPTLQVGDHATYIVNGSFAPPILANGPTTFPAAYSLVGFVPLVAIEVDIIARSTGSTSGNYAAAAPNGSYNMTDTKPSPVFAYTSTGQTVGSQASGPILLESFSIYCLGVNAIILVKGWREPF